jgi:hypothetical protein
MVEGLRHTVIELPDIGTPERGSLLIAEAGKHVPFDIKRLFVLHALPDGAERGYHAHREQHQLLMMLAGASTIIVDDGKTRTPVRLDRPTAALYAPPMHWLELGDFTPGAVCAVLTSDVYIEADYVRDRTEFERLARG